MQLVLGILRMLEYYHYQTHLSEPCGLANNTAAGLAIDNNNSDTSITTATLEESESNKNMCNNERDILDNILFALFNIEGGVYFRCPVPIVDHS